MKLVVGLGNPEKKYNFNRHNVGFIILDAYAENNSAVFKSSGNSLICIIPEKKIILLKPQQYMNNSGTEVNRIANYYNIENKDILIIHDDKDIEFGKQKLKINSSSGGHNGIKDIIKYRGIEFLRLKIGVDNGDLKNTANFVLSDFTNEEKKIIHSSLQFYFQIINDFLNNSADFLMNKYNGEKN